MFSLDMKGVHVDRCVCVYDTKKLRHKQMEGKKKETQTERDGGGENEVGK